MIENMARYEDQSIEEGNFEAAVFYKWQRAACLQQNGVTIILR